jgi:hypothetical protein|tara:strand:- start:221 stop:385 length:165 start_codon:yes stop_codon:yes gene_type:complete
MIKLLLIILLFWVTLKISHYISKIQYFRKYSPKKENKNRKSEMDILDADYEEVE